MKLRPGVPRRPSAMRLRAMATRTARLGLTIIGLGVTASCSQDSSSTRPPVTPEVPVTITTAAALANGLQGTAYSASLSATGGTGNYTWTITSGALPSGLTLGSATGTITGTPTAAGTFTFSVQATSGTQTGSRTFVLIVGVPVDITTATSLSSGVQGTAYSASLSATGGTGSYAWTITSGALPAGLTLAATTGTISGTPTAIGTFTFTIQASSGGQATSRTFTLAVAAPTPVALLWPLAGVDGRDWVINNYVDLDATTGLRDYTGGIGAAAKTYDGHTGVDIDVPDFRWMDGGLSVARAAAAGVVTAVHDGEFDRNTSCVGNPNYVVVRHADGLLATYFHLKKGSVAVVVGQQVAVGATLGLVGSSGCSTGPHLHFELRDAANRVVDPFLNGLWISPPVYATPIGFMDAVIRAGAFSSVLEIEDPAPNATSLPRGSVLGVGISVAGGRPGDVIRQVLTDPTGATFSDDPFTFTADYRHTYWYWNRTLSSKPGVWTITIYLNGVAVKSYTITAT